MCGRFNVEFDESKEIEHIIRRVNDKIYRQELSNDRTPKVGEVFPTNVAAILVGEEGKLEPTSSIWGFKNFKSSGVLINARSETAIEKKTFRESLLSRRCIIPSTGFYEWDQNKKKYLIQNEDCKELYMAGLYNYYNEEHRFVILTTAANTSMEKIHHRMPVLLKKDQMEDWIFESNFTNELFHTIPPEVILKPIEKKFEQMSLFD